MLFDSRLRGSYVDVIHIVSFNSDEIGDCVLRHCNQIRSKPITFASRYGRHLESFAFLPSLLDFSFAVLLAIEFQATAMHRVCFGRLR